MSRFSDYLASYVTPQMTLLEKFNALIKYVDERSLYFHKVKVHITGYGDGNVYAYFINNSSNKIIEETDTSPNSNLRQLCGLLINSAFSPTDLNTYCITNVQISQNNKLLLTLKCVTSFGTTIPVNVSVSVEDGSNIIYLGTNYGKLTISEEVVDLS